MLKETPSFVSKPADANRPSSPSSVAGLSNRIPTVAYAINQVVEAAKTVFVNPLANVPPSIVSKGTQMETSVKCFQRILFLHLLPILVRHGTATIQQRSGRCSY
jgi:hypothetical protein